MQKAKLDALTHELSHMLEVKKLKERIKSLEKQKEHLIKLLSGGSVNV